MVILKSVTVRDEQQNIGNVPAICAAGKKKKDMYKVEVQEGFGGQRKCIPVGDFC